MTEAFLVIGATLIFFAVILIGRRFANRNIVQYTPPDVKSRVGSGNIILLDVRTDNERAVRSIPKSIHIPLHDLAARIDELTEYRGKEIICFCQSGTRSVAAADQLNKLGFKAATLKGGIVAWDEG